MSSPEDCNDSDSVPLHARPKNSERKKRPRACDMCRRRKVRCDGDSMPDGLCTNCKTYDYKCTYAPKKRAIDPEYVQNLESQLAQAQDTIRKLTARLEAVEGSTDTQTSTVSSPSSSSAIFPTCPTKKGSRLPSLPPLNDEHYPSDDDGDIVESVERRIPSLGRKPAHLQFLGKSSSLVLVQQALDMREAATSVNAASPDMKLGPTKNREAFHDMCGEPWQENPWIAPPTPCSYTAEDFPEPDLLPSLVEKYFTNSNVFMPLLNRNLFQRQLDSGLHLRNEAFGSTVLIVCAIGARFSDDRRVLLDGSEQWQTCGWKWFRRVQAVHKTLNLSAATLYDVQVPSLAALYLYGSPTPHTASVLIAYGLRLSMDLGAHKRRVYKGHANTDDELLKRAFWVLVVLDRSLSSVLGRPCCIQDEDFDLEMPAECDDEYWFHEDPTQAFKQPAGKPSIISAFNTLIRLMQIQAATLRTIYATNKSKAHWGMSVEMQQEIVSSLDSALNKWMDSVPEHLRWDPNIESDIHLHQSAWLYSSYYHVQILIHRSFIPLPTKSSTLVLPSLTICTNAARSCVHLLEVQFKRNVQGAYQNLIALFNSGIVLVLNIWADKHNNAPKSKRDLEDVFKVLTMLKHLGQRIDIASKVRDCIIELAAIGDLHFPGDPPRRGLKRSWNDDSSSSASPPTNGPLGTDLATRIMAGTQRVQQHARRASAAAAAAATTPGPSTSADMGSLPPYVTDSVLLNSLWQSQAWMNAQQPDSAPTWNPSFAMPSTSAAGFAASPFAAHNTGGSAFGASPASGSAPTPPQTSFGTGAFAFGNGFMQGGGAPVPDAMAGISTDSPQSWGQASSDQLGTPPQLFDSDVLAMLSSAPTSLEWNDWGAYINNLTDVENVRDISANLANL
ncbi:fungal-specific transcription factor domain-containing protein [Phanerochaete sordida]|uniref:Fungal-specific transcription factor domain-containing protein n=1 Tax=Phanerochaete sordida TaxID=48140 RepID=A0A9P3GRV2_9APHY|nr:fungal-specific transcription factor domain-containing protein [Phanerochaete sordida]